MTRLQEHFVSDTYGKNVFTGTTMFAFSLKVETYSVWKYVRFFNSNNFAGARTD
jgi:hypothetical protein